MGVISGHPPAHDRAGDPCGLTQQGADWDGLAIQSSAYVHVELLYV